MLLGLLLLEARDRNESLCGDGNDDDVSSVDEAHDESSVDRWRRAALRATNSPLPPTPPPTAAATPPISLLFMSTVIVVAELVVVFAAVVVVDKLSSCFELDNDEAALDEPDVMPDVARAAAAATTDAFLPKFRLEGVRIRS